MRSPCENFYEWLRTAKPTDVCIYHTGLLMADRMAGFKRKGPYATLDRQLEDLRIGVLTAWSLGDVLLTQRRLGEGQYEYLATRTQKDRAI